MTTPWNDDELTRAAQAEEVRVSSLRHDGTLSPQVIVWLIRHGDELYLRSVNGPAAAWYRGTRLRHQGHLQARGVDRDVTFVDVDDEKTEDAIDEAYRIKYRRYAARTLDRITSAAAQATTMRLVPR